MSNQITVYMYTDIQRVQAVFLEASWVDALSSGFGQSYFGLYDFGY